MPRGQGFGRISQGEAYRRCGGGKDCLRIIKVRQYLRKDLNANLEFRRLQKRLKKRVSSFRVADCIHHYLRFLSGTREACFQKLGMQSLPFHPQCTEKGILGLVRIGVPQNDGIGIVSGTQRP